VLRAFVLAGEQLARSGLRLRASASRPRQSSVTCAQSCARAPFPVTAQHDSSVTLSLDYNATIDLLAAARPHPASVQECYLDVSDADGPDAGQDAGGPMGAGRTRDSGRPRR